MSFTDNYKDIIVIGAGPAGSSFAKHAAALGLSILLIDGQNEKNAKPCGGLLSPDAQEIFAKAERSLPKEVLCDPQIFSVRTLDIGQDLSRNYQRFYLNMGRRAFDQYLLSEVPDSVDVINGRCKGIEKISVDGGSGFKLQISSFEGEDLELHCRYVVGADGANSIVRKKFYTPIKQFVAIQEWFEKEEGDDMLYACIFDRETSESCSWVIRKDDYMIYGGCFDTRTGRDDYERQLERFREFSGMALSRVKKREACLVNVPRKMKDFETGRDGAYLIGEAAGFISASSFEGISYAINSGRYLAESIGEVCDLKNRGVQDVHLSCFDSRHTVAGGFREAAKAGLSEKISEAYAIRCKKMKRKLYLKIWKKRLLFTPFTRKIIMRSGIQSL